MKTSTIYFISVILIAVVAPLQASSLSIPNSFTAGTPAVAAEVNGNFTAVQTAVDDNDTRIAALEAALATLQADLVSANADITSLQSTVTSQSSDIASLQSTVTSQSSDIASLQSDLIAVNNTIATLQSNSVLDLDGNLIFVLDANGNPTAQFTGVNVQVINGVSQGTINGLGNLIVGYNANTTQGSAVCSDGQFVDQTSCETAGNIWALNHKTGSHNLVGGNNNSYSHVGGLVFGIQNKITRGHSSVTGGSRNNAIGRWSTVSGGYGNRATGDRSHVGGGFGNEARGLISNVSGGEQNKAFGQFSSVLGGFNNTVQDTAPTGKWNAILGGSGQSISGVNSTTIPALP